MRPPLSNETYNVRINLTLWRVHVTAVALEKQEYLF